MNLRELFIALSHGELSNLSMAVDGSGAILEEKQPSVLLAINDGLTRLHTRFILREKQVLIEQQDSITHYHLKEKYTESRAPQVDVPFPYIKDLTGEQFIEDVIKIHAAYDNVYGELPLNEQEQLNSVFTPQADMVQVPQPVTGVLLSVSYQAKHPKLVLADLNASIELPVVLEEALTAYVAYKLYTGINTQEAKAIAAEHMMRYETICQDAIDKGMVTSDMPATNTRFEKRGWV